MQEIKIKDKQNYLDEHFPFEGGIKLTEKRECIHCNTIFSVGDYRVFKTDDGFEMLCCPNFPECGGRFRLSSGNKNVRNLYLYKNENMGAIIIKIISRLL